MPALTTEDLHSAITTSLNKALDRGVTGHRKSVNTLTRVGYMPKDDMREEKKTTAKRIDKRPVVSGNMPQDADYVRAGTAQERQRKPMGGDRREFEKLESETRTRRDRVRMKMACILCALSIR